MKRSVIFLALLAITFNVFAQNTQQFISLFNGHDLSGWTMPGEVPGFEVQNGIMVAEPHNGSDIFTEEEFGNFIFKFEYLLSGVGNSGVLIRCEPENPWGTGVEVQLLAPWTPYRDDLHCTGSIYGHVAVTNRPDETTGIWHNMEIKCDRKNISISVDGEVTTVADIDTVESMHGKSLTGSIGFQSNHSNEGEYVHFRNISVRNLDSEPEYVAKGFYVEDSNIRNQAWEAAQSISAPMIKTLAEMLAGENIMAGAGAKQVLFDIIARATAPDNLKRDSEAVIAALEIEFNKNYPKCAAAYLEWLLEMAKRVK